VAHQRAAARLGSGERLEVAIDRGELGIDVLDHGQGDLDLLAGRRGEIERHEPVAGVAPIETRGGGLDAVVEEHGVDALQPLRPLIDERLAKPHLGAQLEDVLGWDPRARKPPLEQQIAQVPRVALVGLGAPLRSAPRARLRRLGQNDGRAGALQLFHYEPPAGRGLDRRLHLLALPALQEAPQTLAVGGRNASRRHLARGAVERVEGELAPVHVEPDNDSPQDAPDLEGRLRVRSIRRRPDGTPHAIFLGRAPPPRGVYVADPDTRSRGVLGREGAAKRNRQPNGTSSTATASTSPARYRPGARATRSTAPPGSARGRPGGGGGSGAERPA
jgi:hypothetical protein